MKLTISQEVKDCIAVALEIAPSLRSGKTDPTEVIIEAAGVRLKDNDTLNFFIAWKYLICGGVQGHALVDAG